MADREPGEDPPRLTPKAPAEPLVPSDARARELVTTLGLRTLEGESGYFAPLGRSALTVAEGGRTLAAQSRIHYLLARERPIGYLHRLASEDTHVLLEGGPVDYFLFGPGDHVERVTLGRDEAAGQRPVIVAAAGSWKALRLHKGAGYALLVNVLSPEWTPDRVTIGAGAAFLARYEGRAPWTTVELLRELIGPNFRP